ncbi:MAG: iron-sulfur cluster repair di-iron protein, ric [Atopococcus tabaci]|uniref:Iron-sulfur cluster repair di-iron protein, ric n=1 Tax=Atopococcus tabaci TaxID=269774 RepID=A0AA43UCU0_9LACT|nr:iron-sulfur cluster repair di-iron protein, ric [Atopococcus tabaci]
MSLTLANDKKELKTLDLYSGAITKVHGESHPEAFEVREQFEKIQEKITTDKDNLQLDEEFENLRQITNNYEVPKDVCETYEATYKMLEQADKEYHSQ